MFRNMSSADRSVRGPTRTNPGNIVAKKLRCILFWDIENIQVPNGLGHELMVRKLQHFVRSLINPSNSTVAIYQYSNVNSPPSASLFNDGEWIAHGGGPQAADINIKMHISSLIKHKAMTSDIKVVIASNDKDFLNEVKNLRSLGVYVINIYSYGCAHNQLAEKYDYSVDIRTILCTQISADRIVTYSRTDQWFKVCLTNEMNFRAQYVIMLVALSSNHDNVCEIGQYYSQHFPCDPWKYKKILDYVETTGYVEAFDYVGTLVTHGRSRYTLKLSSKAQSEFADVDHLDVHRTLQLTSATIAESSADLNAQAMRVFIEQFEDEGLLYVDETYHTRSTTSTVTTLDVSNSTLRYNTADIDVGTRGYCYLHIFSRQDWSHVAEELGSNPTVQAILNSSYQLLPNVEDISLIMVNPNQYHFISHSSHKFNLEWLIDMASADVARIGMYYPSSKNPISSDMNNKIDIPLKSIISRAGYCYLQLFSVKLQPIALQSLGSWPTSSKLWSFCKLNNLQLDNVYVKVQLVSENTYHIAKSDTSVILSDLFNAIHGSAHIGGRLHLGILNVKHSPLIEMSKGAVVIINVLFIIIIITLLIMHYAYDYEVYNYIVSIIVIRCSIAIINGSLILMSWKALTPKVKLLTGDRHDFNYQMTDSVIPMNYLCKHIKGSVVNSGTVGSARKYPPIPLSSHQSSIILPKLTKVLVSSTARSNVFIDSMPALGENNNYVSWNPIFYNSVSKFLGLSRISMSFSRSAFIKPQRYDDAIQVPTVPGMTKTAETLSQLYPRINLTYNHATSSNALFYTMISIGNHTIKHNMISNTLAIVYNSDPLLWDIDGYYHCINSGDKYQVPVLFDEQLHNTNKSIGIYRPVRQETALHNYNYRADFLIFPLTQYIFDIKTLIADACKKQISTIFCLEINCKDMLTKSVGVLASLNLKWHVTKTLVGELFVFSTLTGGSLSFELNADIVRQHMLTNRVTVDKVAYIKSIVTIIGDLNVIKYTKGGYNSCSTSIQLTNYHAQHYQMLLTTNISNTLQYYLGTNFDITLIPTPIITAIKSTARRNINKMTVATMSANATTITSTFTELTKDPVGLGYIEGAPNLDAIAGAILEVAKLESIVNIEEDPHGSEQIRSSPLLNTLKYIISSVYRKRLWARNHLAIMNSKFTYSADYRPLDQDASGIYRYLLDSQSSDDTYVSNANSLSNLRNPILNRVQNVIESLIPSYNNYPQENLSQTTNNAYGTNPSTIEDIESGSLLGLPKDINFPNETTSLLPNFVASTSLDASNLPANTDVFLDKQNMESDEHSKSALSLSVNEFTNLTNHTTHFIGVKTNHRVFDANFELEHYNRLQNQDGYSYPSYMNDGITAVFKCPEQVYQLLNSKVLLADRSHLLYMALAMYISRMYVIKGNRFIGPSISAQNIKTCPILQWNGDNYIRYVPNDANAFTTVLCSKIHIQGDILDLGIADYLNVADVDTKLCFFKAIPNYIIPAGATCCTPEKIRTACADNNYAIYHNRIVYLPNDAIPAGLVYVQGTHAYKCEVPDMKGFIYLFPRVKTNQWALTLNGPINSNTLIELNMMKDFQKAMTKCHNMGARLNSIIEMIEYNIALQYVLISKLSFLDDSSSINYLRSMTNVHIYDVDASRFINGRPANKHTNCWSKGHFQEMNYNYTHKLYECRDAGKYLYISDEISFLRERQLIAKCYPIWDDIVQYNFDSIHITLKDGVPGCGKTYTIKQDHTSGLDLVCTSTRAARQEYLRSYSNNPEYYRTYDSVCLNGCPNCDIMFADEGLMEHAGMLLIVAFIAKCTFVYISGDKLQIPFISRVIGFAPKNHILNLDDHQIIRNTYRLPKHMEPILAPFYPGIKSLSDVQYTEDPSVHKIPTPLLIPSGFDVYLCFTQDEKKTLSHLINVSILTVHEAQGGTWNKVCLFRTMPQETPIYQSVPHIIVGISRHRVKLSYYTVITNDTTCKILDRQPIEAEYYIQLNKQLLKPIDIYKLTPPQIFFKFVTIDSVISEEYSDTVDWICEYARCTSSQPLRYTKMGKLCPNPVDTDDCLPVLIDEVQDLYDSMFTPITDSTYYRNLNQNVFPLEVDFKVIPQKLLEVKPSTTDYLIPNLKTVQPPRDAGTIQEAVISMRKRNLDPPVLHFTRPPEIVDEIVNKFFDTYLDEKKLKQFKIDNPARNAQWWIEWFNSRTPTRKRALKSFPQYARKETTFAAHDRQDPKAKLDNTHPYGIVPRQVVTAHHPVVTAKYAGIAKYMANALIVCLLPKWLINEEVTIEELNGHLNYILQNWRKCTPQEIDFSKFDKSQEEICLAILVRIAERLGVPKDLCDEWFDSHTINRIVFHRLGISLYTKFQRRSGDALTFLGNTIVLMAVLAYTHDYTKAIGGIFGGDDSLVFLPPDLVVHDQSKHIAEVFNLIAKIELFPEAPYFASKFLIYADEQYYMIPDPIKAITRLGKHDLYCDEHIKEAWISFKENFKAYSNADIRREVAKAALLRYKRIMRNIPTNLYIIPEFIAHLRTNFASYKELYSGRDFLRKRKLPNALKEELTRKQSRQLPFIADQVDEIFYDF